MKIAVQCAFSMFILVVSAKAQQIGSVDLTHPPVLDEFEERPKGPFLPNGCVKFGGAIGDGAVVPKKDEPDEITTEVTNINSEEHAAGSVLQAEVQLRNSGDYPLKIPWNTDPNAVKRNQNPNHLSWEVGKFHVLLDRDDLKNLGQSLYGSKFSQGSMLTIQPGEWITATVKFRLELEQPYPEHAVGLGKRQLRVEWEQASYKRTLDLKKCEQLSGYFTYRNYYQQKTPAVTITVTRDHSDAR